MNISLQSKLPEVKTSIFSVMTQMCHQENALNLSQGFPDFPSDPVLMELVHKAMKEGKNQYAPMQGIFSLRKAIADKTERLYGVSYDPETEITITAGATQAIFTALSAVVQIGDEVIIFKPAYDCYEPTIELLGATAVPIQLDPEKMEIDFEILKSKITKKTKLIIINTPHNPSGRLISKEEMTQLEALLKGTDILLLSDEVYEHIIFEGKEHESAVLFPGLKERAFIIASFGKTFHNTGWKLGYCMAPKFLMQEFQKVHQFNVFSVNHPSQVALATYLQDPDNYLTLGAFYQKKRDLFLNLIKDSRFDFTPSEGTYFQLLNYKNISGESDVKLAEKLAKEHKIGSIPISVFNETGYDTFVLRFCFAKTDETLEKAAEILCKI